MPRASPCRPSRSEICRWAVRGKRPSRPGLPTTVWREVARRASCSAATAGARPPLIRGPAPRLGRRSAGEGTPGTPVCTARLAVTHLEGMRSGGRRELEVLAGRRVTAAAGIADPESFAAQLGTAGASVQLVAYQDHHAYRREDLERLVRVAAGGGYGGVTEKDAVEHPPQWAPD